MLAVPNRTKEEERNKKFYKVTKQNLASLAANLLK
jgi:hypothetical protein